MMTSRNGVVRNKRGQVAPHDLLAEKNLLGAAMLDTEALAVAAGVPVEAFYKPAHAHIAVALQSFHERGAAADPVTVAAELREAGLLDTVGGHNALVELMACAPAVSNVGQYAEIVKATAARRQLLTVAAELATAAHEKADAGQAVALAEKLLGEAAQDSPTATERPVPLDKAAELPEFPAEVFPRWVRDQVEAVTDFAQVPVDLPAVVALTALAACAGGRVSVQVRGPWHEPTNLFGVVALPPGSRKSAVFSQMTGPLVTAESALAVQVEEEIRSATVEREIADREAAKATQKAASTGDAEARDDALRLAEAAGQWAIPTRPRLVADDVTPEAAATLLAEQGGRLAVLSAEGGIFQILAGRYSGAPSLELFLKGHAGDALRVDRKGRPPEFVASPALTLGLTVQPEVLRSISDIPGFRGLGLLARILYSLPKNTVGARKVGTLPPDPAISDTYHNHLVDLTHRLHERTEPAVLTLSPEAAQVLLDFERETEPRLAPETGDLGHMADWASKLAGACARIAGLLHLAEHRGGTGYAISADTMAAAVNVARYFTAHAIAVFSEMGADPDITAARQILAWIHRNGDHQFSRRDVLRGCRNLKAGDLDSPLRLLEDHGWIRPTETHPGPTGGRPRSPAYTVHPEAIQ